VEPPELPARIGFCAWAAVARGSIVNQERDATPNSGEYQALTLQDGERQCPGWSVNKQVLTGAWADEQHHDREDGTRPLDAVARVESGKQDGRSEPDPVMDPAHRGDQLGRDAGDQPRLEFMTEPVAGASRPQPQCGRRE